MLLRKKTLQRKKKLQPSGSFQSGAQAKKGHGSLLRRKGLNRQSDRRKKLDVIYYTKRKEFLEKNPRCMIYPHLEAVHVHHTRGRGRFYLDEQTWMALSAQAHQEVHDNVQWSRARGYIHYGKDGK